MKVRKLHFSYRYRLAFALIIFTLLPCLVLGGIYLKQVRPQWIHSTLDKYYNAADSTALLVSERFNEMQSKMHYIIYDSSTVPYISRLDSLSLNYKQEVLEKLDTMSSSLTVDNNELVIRWYPYYNQESYGGCCYSLNVLEQEFIEEDATDKYDEILSLKCNEPIWMVRQINRSFTNAGKRDQRLCLYTQLGSLGNSNCILELSIPLTQLYDSDQYDNLSGGLFSLCLSQEQINIPLFNDTLSTPDDLILEYQKNGQVSGFYPISSAIPNVSDGQVLLLLPDSYISECLSPYKLSFACITALIAIIIVLSSLLTSHLLTQRVVKLIDTINNNLDSYFTNSDKTRDTDDFANISARIGQLIQNTQDYCNQIEYYKSENMRMELELLQQSFNPHLLYNTMSVLKCRIKDPMLQNMIDSLCHYYRIILSNGHLIIPLKDEIEMIREYLLIQKITYGLKDIEFDIQIEEELQNIPIIKHILQPIVENALNHGLRSAKRKGLLNITALKEECCIVIRISDDGIGMSPDTCAQLLKKPLVSIPGGYGIYNVQQRIQLYYGSEYGLNISSQVGEGTVVSIRFPSIPPRI